MGGLLLAGVVVYALAGGRLFPTSPADGEAAFLTDYWRRPIPAQGDPPARFSALERSLRPESCGVCHPAQWSDWKSSLHAKAMGPGVTGQLVEMRTSAPSTAALCLTCHAPLAEQQPDGAAFDPALHREGLVCAACHVRNHQRFGPPRRDGSVDERADRTTLPHQGATRVRAFLRSEFCSPCHQFAPDGLALNGKLLENTYEEWKTSPAAGQGLQCQDCHMPDRRHLWRGIHDPDTVHAGLDIALAADRSRYAVGDEVRAVLTITASRVGHYFPTYVTPRVVVRFALVDASGQALAGLSQEHVIAREVTLDLSRELSDTRIPPGGQASFEYRRRLDRPGLHLRVTITVFPDHFYTGFFRSLLRAGAGRGEPAIREALDATLRSSFDIFDRTLPLT
ncbi:MAG TPA: multiheme c-type cytochrome [Candidatus Binatia bacterium]|nr:multiheme c-type cytochrome [Candidatus Binatia bacterium]